MVQFCSAHVVRNLSALDTRDRIAHFKAPKAVEFGELPKTATGKIQKYVLRDKEWAGREKRIQGSTA